MSLRVSQLIVYPVKSCAGVSLQESELVAGGLEMDRRYMLVDDTGQFLSARTVPLLLAVQILIESESLILSFKGQDSLLLPAIPSFDASRAELEKVSVWRDELMAQELPRGSRWFSKVLSRSVRLVYQPQDSLRQVNQKYAQKSDRVSLADGYPLLLTNQASLDDLNARLKEPVPMSRFRPNVVVTGAEPYAEDRWSKLQIGELQIEAPKLCDRCVMTTVDPERARASKEPLRTLATYRRWQGAVWFGTNLLPRTFGKCRVQDPVIVQEMRDSVRENI